MNSIVHLSIANQTYQKSRKMTNSHLFLPLFLIGNVWPDLDRRMSKIPHEMNASLTLLKGIVNEIKSPSYANRLMERISRSFLVGIFCHFISDYFCYAHTPRFTDNIYRHHLYEFRMIGYIRRSKHYANVTNEFVMNRTEDIEDFLTFAHNRYLSDQAGYITDLAHAMYSVSVLFEHLTDIAIETRTRNQLPCKNFRSASNTSC